MVVTYPFLIKLNTLIITNAQKLVFHTKTHFLLNWNNHDPRDDNKFHIKLRNA